MISEAWEAAHYRTGGWFKIIILCCAAHELHLCHIMERKIEQVGSKGYEPCTRSIGSGVLVSPPTSSLATFCSLRRACRKPGRPLRHTGVISTISSKPLRISPSLMSLRSFSTVGTLLIFIFNGKAVCPYATGTQRPQ